VTASPDRAPAADGSRPHLPKPSTPGMLRHRALRETPPNCGGWGRTSARGCWEPFLDRLAAVTKRDAGFKRERTCGGNSARQANRLEETEIGGRSEKASRRDRPGGS